MRRLVVVGLVLLAVAGVVLAGCAAREGAAVSEITELKWEPINPPRPGLNCWIATYTASAGYGGYGYGFTYCEPIEP